MNNLNEKITNDTVPASDENRHNDKKAIVHTLIEWVSQGITKPAGDYDEKTSTAADQRTTSIDMATVLPIIRD